jgi:hypothetical protein
MKYRQMENQDATLALTAQHQAQQMEIAKAHEARSQAEFDQKQKEANTFYPASFFFGSEPTPSQVQLLEEAKKSGLAETVGGVTGMRAKNFATFNGYLKSRPEISVNLASLELSRLNEQIGGLRDKLNKNPEDDKSKADLQALLSKQNVMAENYQTLISHTPSVAEKVAIERAKKEQPKVVSLFHNENGDIVRQLDNGQVVNSMNDPYEGDPAGLVKVGGEAKPKTDRWGEPFDMNVDGKKVRVQKEETTGQIRTVAQGPTVNINTPTPEESKSIVEMIHDNGLDPTQIPKRGGVWNKAMVEWKKQYPNENINDYAAFAKWKRDTSVNKSMTLLDSIEPMLVEMEKLHKELGLSDFKDLNKMKVWIKDHTGDPKVAKYETFMRNVVQELPPAMTGYFPTDTRIKMELVNLETPKAPAQIGASISAVRELVRVRRQQFNSPSWSPLMKNQTKPEVKRLTYNPTTGELE